MLLKIKKPTIDRQSWVSKLIFFFSENRTHDAWQPGDASHPTGHTLAVDALTRLNVKRCIHLTWLINQTSAFLSTHFFKAARNSSSVRPLIRPVARSSMRRTPSSTTWSTDAGTTTLSTRRRAKSSLSLGGNSNANRAKSSEPMCQISLHASLMQARKKGRFKP